MWAIRGSGGFGGPRGGLYAGFAYGLFWYVLSREDAREKSRRYSSPWVILAIFAGIGVASARGWMQWAHWVQGTFYVDFPSESLPINPVHGYAWWFLAALSWGGLGAIFLAWTGSKEPPTARDWGLRFLLGGVGTGVAGLLFAFFPQAFLPHYAQLDAYATATCPQCHDPYKDNLATWSFLGCWAGFVAYEIFKRDWRNVKLVLTIAGLTGLTWVGFQAWHFVDDWLLSVDPGVRWDWWKGWEILSGMGIGIAYAVGWALWNQPLPPDHPEARRQPYSAIPRWERLLGFHATIMAGVILAIRQGSAGFLKHVGVPKAGRQLVQLWVVVIGVAGGLVILGYLYRASRANPAPPGKGGKMASREALWIVTALAVVFVVGLLVTGSFLTRAEPHFTTGLSLWIIYWGTCGIAFSLLHAYSRHRQHYQR